LLARLGRGKSVGAVHEFVEAVAELGGHEPARAVVAAEVIPDQPLGKVIAIAFRRIDEVDPRVERFVDDADRVVVVGVADGRGEHQCAERVGADLDAGPAEGAVLHAVSPFGGRGGQTS